MSWSAEALGVGDRVVYRSQMPNRPWILGEVTRVTSTQIAIASNRSAERKYMRKSGKSVGDLDIYTTYLSEPTPERVAAAEAYERRQRIIERWYQTKPDTLSDAALAAIDEALSK